MEDYLSLVAHSFDLEIHSFVLMSNHYHLLVTARDHRLSDALEYLQRETSRECNRLSGRINQTWGGRNHKTLIVGHHHYMNSYKYVYRNPVRAGLCTMVEEYPYSTLHGLCGLSRLIIPVADDTILFSPTLDQQILTWLNVRSKPEHEEEVRRALRRPQFELKTCRATGRPSELEKLLI